MLLLAIGISEASAGWLPGLRAGASPTSARAGAAPPIMKALDSSNSPLTPPELLSEAEAMLASAASTAEQEANKNLKAALEQVTMARTAAEAEAQRSLNAAVDTVNQAREAAEVDAVERIAEVASDLADKSRAASRAVEGLSGGGVLSSLPGVLLARRTLEIWTFIAEISTKMLAANRSGSKERKQQVSEDLCEGLLKLGPTFIKLGQILSTRYDILPYDYVKGLERLQDSVPAFDSELAYSIVQSEIGENAFSAFDREPIAAASLGQVHLATTAAGERVAVKVQRPGLKQLFDADLINLKILAELLYKLDTTPDSMLRDWREIFESNARIIYEEIDYTKEATNGRKFARNFREFPWIKGAPHRCRAQRAAVPSSAQLISPSQIPLLLSACR